MNMTRASEAPIRIMIADDHELARGGLKSFFVNDPTFAMVAEAADEASLLRLCAEQSPDLLLLDIRLGESDGLKLALAIRERFPAVRIIMVTMHEDVQYLVEALRVGAAGYMLKDAPRSEFLSAARRVAHGETAFNPQLMARALQSLAAGPVSGPAALIEPLTAREQDVLALITAGKTNRQIAAALHISPGTVKVHVEHIIAKLGVADRTQAAVRAIELGLTRAPAGHGR